MGAVEFKPPPTIDGFCSDDRGAGCIAQGRRPVKVLSNRAGRPKSEKGNVCPHCGSPLVFAR